MATYPLATLAATVSPAGISAPPYSDIYGSLQASFQAIYGSDAYIDPDSQDGQLLAIVAKAISDSNDAVIACYNNFSPQTGQGAALSSNVKINGLSRLVATNSQCLLRVTGQIGSIIVAGIAADAAGNQWALPDPTVIPPAGFIDVTATCTAVGAVAALVGTIVNIVNPQLGWQSVTNNSVASLGAPIESDVSLRQRQTFSTSLPGQTILDGIHGGILGLPGVTRCRVFENDTDTTDANGQTAHSIAAMVVGGVAQDIGNMIAVRKAPGVNTVGSTSVTVINDLSITSTMKFTIPSTSTITTAATIKALYGYDTTVGAAITAAIQAAINATDIGGGVVGGVEWDLVFMAVRTIPKANTFKLESLVLTGPSGAGTPDVPLLYDHIALASTVTLTVT